jgi:hypothetical protein
LGQGLVNHKIENLNRLFSRLGKSLDRKFLIGRVVNENSAVGGVARKATSRAHKKFISHRTGDLLDAAVV